MTDTTPDIDSYCCSTHCINCKNRLLRRLPISRSKNRRYSDYSVSRQRIEIYASLPLCNNPFHYGLLYAQDTDAPKLCASCAKHFRAYLKVYGSSLAKKRLASETGETCAFRPESKTRRSDPSWCSEMMTTTCSIIDGIKDRILQHNVELNTRLTSNYIAFYVAYALMIPKERQSCECTTRKSVRMYPKALEAIYLSF